jgi:hypothetical protein
MSTTKQIRTVIARDKVCMVDGCDRRHLAKGFCGMHWQRVSKHGSTELVEQQRTPMVDRFWAKVRPTGFCWEWTGAKDSHGYGVFRTEGKNDRSHRVAYTLLVGAIPAGLHLDHLCRNTSCCNPDHLDPVTPRVNYLRGQSPAAQTHRLGVCRRGHTMADAYVRPDTGARMCRECCRIRKANRVHS